MPAYTLSEWRQIMRGREAYAHSLPTPDPIDVVAARIRQRLEDAGRPAGDAEHVAAGLLRAHREFHAEPRSRCPYCPPRAGGRDRSLHTTSVYLSVEPLEGPEP